MRKITKIKRSIKAISPVISVLLMIAIAVVASLVVYAWVMGYVGFQTNRVGKALQIQSSAFSTDLTQLTVYVQNVGQGTEQFNFPSNTVYVNNVPQNIVTVNPSGMLSGSTITLAQGQTVGLTVNYLYTPGQQLNIKVVTSDGTTAQTTGSGTSGSTSGGAASIALNTPSGNAGSSDTVTGSGFAVSSALTLTFDATQVATSMSTPSGSLPTVGVTFTVPSGASVGMHTVTVTDASANSASTTFSVTAPTQYLITVTQTANGGITPVTGLVNAGSTPQYTITPNSGYQIATITANGANVPVTVSAGQSQTYTFAAVTSTGTLTAIFTVIPAAPTLDVSNTAHTPGTGSNTMTIGLTTTKADLVYVAISAHDSSWQNSVSVSSVVAGTTSFTRRSPLSYSGYPSYDLETWYAYISTPGSISITITLSRQSDAAAVALAVSGVNPTANFDPAITTVPTNSHTYQHAASVTITSTSHAYDFIIGALGTQSNPGLTATSGTGYLGGSTVTAVSADNSVQVSIQYGQVTTTQTNLGIGYSWSQYNNQDWGMIGDALQSP